MPPADPEEASANAAIAPRKRFSRGRRPFFMNDPDVDRVLAIVTALAGEVATLKDRLDTVTRLARAGLPATPENIEAFSPTPEDEAERDAARDALLDRVFRILALGQFDSGREDKSYQSIVDEVS